MGVVYEAEQLSLGRRIALKVLPFAAMLDRQQLARFKNEARAAATLDHPNSSPSTPSAPNAASTTTPCSSSKARAWRK
jgi:serine/threonine protein kinase